MTLHRMVKDPDAGAIVDQEGAEISPRDTAEQAFRKVLPCARRVLSRQLDALLTGTAKKRRRTILRRRISPAETRRWPYSLEPYFARNLQSHPRRHRSVSGRVHRREWRTADGLVG